MEKIMIKPFSIYLDQTNIEKLSSNFKEIVTNGQFVLGCHTDALERTISKSAQVEFTKVVSSGTVALEVVFEYLASLGHKRVAVQSNTNFATVSAVIRAGLELIYIDCDDLGQICKKDLEAKYQKYKFDTAAIVHIGGYISADLEEIVAYLENKNIILIEDCAHAHGARNKNGAAGSFGFASIFSFFPTKLVNGGEGGAVCTDDSSLSDFVHKWRNQGKSDVYGNHHTVLGGSYRMPEINCAIALEYYSVLESEIQSRSRIYHILVNEVQNISFPILNDGDQPSFYKLICRIPGRSADESEKFLLTQGVQCGGAVYRKPCHLQPVFKEQTNGITDLNATQIFCDEHFCPPLHSNISDEQIQTLINAMNMLGTQT